MHAFPSAVATPLLSRVSTGLVRLLMTRVIYLVDKLFATLVNETGVGALFHFTSDGYSIKNGTVPLTDGVEKSPIFTGDIFQATRV